jgi:hypothetical protein
MIIRSHGRSESIPAYLLTVRLRFGELDVRSNSYLHIEGREHYTLKRG